MNLEQVQSFSIPETDHAYTWKDTILYALGLGYGSDPLDEAELPYVYERGLQAVPTICNTLAHPGFWLDTPALEIDWVKVLHAEQSIEMHEPLSPDGAVRGSYEIVSVVDKGADKGAILTLEKRLTDIASGRLLCTVATSVFLRGDGGQGGFGPPPATATALPDRVPDETVDIATLPQAALVYRLSGDVNPLHADPRVATKAGFRQPILHGLATMGVAARALLRARCGSDPARLGSMFVRFSRPVYPGETIRTEIFDTADGIRFRCRVVERDVVVLDRGSLGLKD
ncbi:MAG: MaoC/PaaZ C-terminal domain-containing protein [Allosphingosinicella sp.]|uniref:MaoC/PaaZ C-terminal domain-containing protein n=1 Tax=Allosphingosinicella sp. TaxID=2823234 RepID=UPI003928797D